MLVGTLLSVAMNTLGMCQLWMALVFTELGAEELAEPCRHPLFRTRRGDACGKYYTSHTMLKEVDRLVDPSVSQCSRRQLKNSSLPVVADMPSRGVKD